MTGKERTEAENKSELGRAIDSASGDIGVDGENAGHRMKSDDKMSRRNPTRWENICPEADRGCAGAKDQGTFLNLCSVPGNYQDCLFYCYSLGEQGK